MPLVKGSKLGYYRIVIESPSTWFELFRCLPKSLSRRVRSSVNRCVETKVLSGDKLDPDRILKMKVWLYSEDSYPDSQVLFHGKLEDLYKEFL